MKGWVVPYLRANGYTYSDDGLKIIERIDSETLLDDDIITNQLKIIKIFLEFSELNCCFLSDKIEYKKDRLLCQQRFIVIFGSVLLDLEKKYFDKLCNNKDIYYIFRPVIAYQQTIENKENINKTIVFCYALGNKSVPVTVSRGVIVHELAHIITGKNRPEDEASMNQMISEEWGFKQEIQDAIEFENKWYDLWPKLPSGDKGLC